MLAGLDRDAIYRLVKSAPDRPDSKGKQSSLLGDVIHDWIDQVIKGSLVSDIDTSFYVGKYDGEEHKTTRSMKWTWNAFKKFLDIYQPDWVMSEFTVWSDTYGYAGTMDWAARIRGPASGKRVLTLGDNKTGGNVYPDMAMQLAAGQFADFILYPDAEEETGYRKVRIPEFNAYGILHLRPRGMQLVPMFHIPEAFQGFLGLKQAFDWNIARKDDTIGMSPKYQVRAGEFSD